MNTKVLEILFKQTKKFSKLNKSKRGGGGDSNATGIMWVGHAIMAHPEERKIKRETKND